MEGPVKSKTLHRRPGGGRVGTTGRVGDAGARKAPHIKGGKRDQDKREAEEKCQLVASLSPRPSPQLPKPPLQQLEVTPQFEDAIRARLEVASSQDDKNRVVESQLERSRGEAKLLQKPEKEGKQ